LLHPTSLPGPHGCGDLGPEAHAFVDALAAAGQSWWQMLPVVPPGAGDSPYSSCSAFAGSPLLVSLSDLASQGLLSRSELRPPRSLSARRVNYAATSAFRESRLRIAFLRFQGDASASDRRAFQRFRRRASSWLCDFALFSALRSAQRGRPWNQWPAELRDRKPASLRRAADELREDIAYHAFVQYQFDRQWRALRKYCVRRGIGLIGDIPIFVSHDSSDVWSHPGLFQLDPRGRPRRVSGCPPDCFSETGQLWGHPLYAWTAHRRGGFAWWMSRFRRTAELFDAARIDHFLGFNRCWSIAGRARTAKYGRWQAGPGDALFDRLQREHLSLEIFAEDLGVVVPKAVALRDRFGFPGMRVLQTAFGGNNRYDQPHNYPRHSVAYAATHDTGTLRGWLKSANRARQRGPDGLTDRARALRYLGGDARTFHSSAIRALYASAANTVIVPMQDVFGLDDRARMNVPGTPQGNWQWRMTPGQFDRGCIRRLRKLAETFERIQ
jgi:4-alpha-glucanotransferase